MRQPDNLPAFCRVHRNGRPHIMHEREFVSVLQNSSAPGLSA
jgi:hypothetical protein